MCFQSNTKTCSKCNQEKPRSEFGPRSDSPDGLRGQCRPCRAQVIREYHAQDPERRRQNDREYHAKNRSAHLARMREYRKTYQRKPLTEEQRERMAARGRNYYQRNREYKLAVNQRWFKSNPEKARAISENYRARKRGADGNYTAEEFTALCQQYGNRCLACGKEALLTADHVIPLSCGGSNDISNIQNLCQVCNSSKGAKSTDYRPANHVIQRRQLRFFD